VIVIDTSAIAALLFVEPDALIYATAMNAATTRLLSAVTRVELSFVVEGRKGEVGRLELERLLDSLGTETVAVTAQHATLAIHAFRKFGKGRHPAALNIGDCFSYALASATGYPLLFKGRDFTRTDVRPALSV